MSKVTQKQTYTWKDGVSFSITANEAYAEFERIRKARGDLTATIVVEEAKVKNSPLHDEFEWNNAKAAHAHREEQARSMMRSIRVIYREAPKHPTRVYHAVAAPPSDEPRPLKVYRRTEDLLKDPETRAELLQRALNELVSCRRRYAQLQELSIAWRAIDKLLEKTTV